jgi:hypothetical protein
MSLLNPYRETKRAPSVTVYMSVRDADVFAQTVHGVVGPDQPIAIRDLHRALGKTLYGAWYFDPFAQAAILIITVLSITLIGIAIGQVR